MALSDGPKTLPEIQEHFYAFGRLFGFIANFQHHNPAECDQLAQQLLQDLDGLLAAGWVKRLDERYALTGTGQQQANKQLDRIRRFGNWLQRLKQPQTVSKVAVAAHLVLAAIKLPVGLISGSIGLINDAADTLGIIALNGENTTINKGNAAPMQKVAADASAAWTGRALVISEIPSSSRAWALRASLAISCSATVSARL